jgi:hypothetical protein
MRRATLLLVLLTAAQAAAQVQSRPTDPPLVTAANESWYVLREPISVAGELYYPAGATVFFDGDTMVRTGHYNGVPLYTDTTVEPFSVILVPVTRGLMQPYERPRSGTLAGTTGSRTPSFPVQVSGERTPAGAGIGAAAGPPTTPPQPAGAIGVYTPEQAVGTSSGALRGAPAQATDGAVATSGRALVRPTGPPVVSLMRPQSNDGLWVQFRGQKWVNRGAAVPLTGGTFMQIGEYARFPVYARSGSDDNVIYLPTRAGLVAPYTRKR